MSADKKRALLVSGDKGRLRLIQSFATAQSAWTISGVESAAQALAELSRQPFDAVVSDWLLDQGGLRLLDQAAEAHPKCGTVMLVNAEADSLKCVGSAHRLLDAQCESDAFIAALDNACDATAWAPNEAVRKLIGGMKVLPSPPSLYFRVLKEVQSSLQSLENIGWLIARDPALSAKLLQLANSAAMGLRTSVTNTIEASVYLGSKRIESLLLLAHTFATFEKTRGFKFNITAFCEHSTRVSQNAQALCKAEKIGAAASDSAFTAGLLHDLGKLALAANFAEQYVQMLETVRAAKISEAEAEARVFGTTHAELGASLLASWGLPRPIVEAVARHHQPSADRSQRFNPTLAVHAANALDHASPAEDDFGGLDMERVNGLGLSGRAAAWKSICHPHDDEDR